MTASAWTPVKLPLAKVFYEGPLHMFSASQISRYRECARKWAWRYIAKIDEPQGPAQALGDEIETAQLQPYLLEDRPFDYTAPTGSGYMAAALLSYLPRPQTPGLVMQKHFAIPSPTWLDGKHVGFGFQGNLDLFLPDSSLVPDMAGGVPYVGDFKSKKDLKWALTEEQLKEDVQANLYSFVIMKETGARAIDVDWLNTQTVGPKRSHRTRLRMIAADVAERFCAINDTALEMWNVLQTVTEPLQLPPTPTACGAFGGCAHRSRCNLGPLEILDAMAAQAARLPNKEVSIPMTNSADLIANLKARKAGQAPAPAASTAPPAAAPTPGVDYAAINREAAERAAAAAGAVAAQAKAAEELAAFNAWKASQATSIVVPPPAPIDAALPDWAKATTPYAGHAAMTGTVSTLTPGLSVSYVPPAPNDVPINPPESLLPPAPIAGPKRGRGRPPKVAAAAPAPLPSVEERALSEETGAISAEELATAVAAADASIVERQTAAPPGAGHELSLLAMATAYDQIGAGFAQLAKATRMLVVGK